MRKFMKICEQCYYNFLKDLPIRKLLCYYTYVFKYVHDVIGILHIYKLLQYYILHYLQYGFP